MKNNIVCALLRHRTRQLRYEREMRRGVEETNTILAAFLADLVEERGEARVSRAKIKETVGKYSAVIACEGDDYVIGVDRVPSSRSDKHGGK